LQHYVKGDEVQTPEDPISDVEKLYVDAFREATRSLQFWLVWALGASASLLVSAYNPASPDEKNSVSGLLFRVGQSGTEIIALAIYCVAGIMAIFALESRRRARHRIRMNHELLDALSLFPSLATLPQPWMRAFAALLPFLLILWAAITQNMRSTTPAEWFNVVAGLIILSVPHFLVALYMAGESSGDSDSHATGEGRRSIS